MKFIIFRKLKDLRSKKDPEKSIKIIITVLIFLSVPNSSINYLKVKNISVDIILEYQINLLKPLSM